MRGEVTTASAGLYSRKSDTDVCQRIPLGLTGSLSSVFCSSDQPLADYLDVLSLSSYCWRVTDKLIGPLNEILHVWRIGVAGIMLSPRQVTVEEAFIHRR